MKADQILAVSRAKDIFLTEMEFKRMRSLWHPDKNKDPKAAEVFNHINDLWNKVKAVAMGQSKDFDLKSGQVLTVKYHYQYMAGNLGAAHIHTSDVLFHVPEANTDLVRNWDDNQAIFLEQLAKCKQTPAIDSLEKGFFSHSTIHLLEDGSSLVAQQIPRLYFPLRQFYNHYNGKLPAKQAAWIITRMFTSAQLFQLAGMTSNAFTLDSFFIFPGPGSHGGFELAAFGYSSVIGGKLKFLPAENIDFYPQSSLANKQATQEVDLVLLKRTGIQLLGDPTGAGTKLIGDPEVPVELLNFLRSPTKTSDTPIDVYPQWHDEVIIKAFGPRKLVECGFSSEDIYQENA